VQVLNQDATPEVLSFLPGAEEIIHQASEEIQKVQQIVNEKIRQDLIVYDEELLYKKAIEEGVIALFDEKYGDIVRVLRIGRPAVSAELCGGTHVAATGEIGFFQIIGETSIDKIIEHGSKPEGNNPALAMPAYGNDKKLTPQQIADVIAYIISKNTK
jgi:alanyl-tRNA synthetase